MKKYTYNLIVKEGCNEFWEDINNRKVTGCEEVTYIITQALCAYGLYVGDDDFTQLKLVKFEETLDGEDF